MIILYDEQLATLPTPRLLALYKARRAELYCYGDGWGYSPKIVKLNIEYVGKLKKLLNSREHVNR